MYQIPSLLLILPPALYIMLLFTWAIGIVTTVTQASLFYLAPIVGAIVGEGWGHFFNDFLQNRSIRTHKGQFNPETRLWAVYPACAIGVGAMVLYGQTLQKGLPVIGLAAAWAMMSLSQVASTTAISAYALDSFPHHAALASAWINQFMIVS